jgi:hypothetical protein
MSPRPRAIWRDVRDRMFLSAAQLEELRRDAEAAGRKAWDRATRTGSHAVARTTKELQELGARTLDLVQVPPKKSGGAPPAKQQVKAAQPKAPGVRAPPRPAPSKPVTPGTFLDPINAGARGAVDAATFGLGDKYEAAKVATKGLFSGKDWGDTYQEARQKQEAADDYDREHHPFARAAGGTIGAVGSIAMTGGASAPARMMPYVSRAVGNGGRAVMAHVGPHAAIAGAGATTSVGSQMAADWPLFVATGRVKDPGDYIDTAVGGAVGGLATAYRGPRAGAVASALSEEAMRGARTGEFSLENVQQNAVLGAHAARAGDLWGRSQVDKLDFRQKGKLGEAMSEIKTYVAGQEPAGYRKKRKTSVSHTYLDSITDADLWIESKFGRGAQLSDNQKAALREFDNYRVDWWEKPDVGKVSGGFSGLLFQSGYGDNER